MAALPASAAAHVRHRRRPGAPAPAPAMRPPPRASSSTRRPPRTRTSRSGPSWPTAATRRSSRRRSAVLLKIRARRGLLIGQRPRVRAREQRRGQAADAHEAHSPGQQHRHKPQGARQRRADGLCRGRGGRGSPTPRTPECAISSSTPQGRARNRGMRPTEAAEANLGHPGKRHALVWNAADCNAAMLGAIKPASETLPPRWGFRRCRSGARRRRAPDQLRAGPWARILSRTPRNEHCAPLCLEDNKVDGFELRIAG